MSKKKMYTPLHILQRAKELNGLDVEILTEDDILDDIPNFMSWAISDAFMKQRYKGKYAKENQRLLNIRKSQFSDIPYQAVRTEMRDICVIPGMLKSWNEYRQAYRFDTDFVDELLNTKTVKIPVSVFERLRYPCYYIDLEEDTRFHPFIGFFVYVCADIETEFPNIAVLRVTDPLPNEEDEVIHSAYLTANDMLSHGMVLKNRENDFSICLGKNQEINNTHRNVLSFNDQNGGTYDFEEPNVKQFLMFALQTILYLCSHEPDIRESQKNIHIKRKEILSLESKNTISLSDVGVRYGSIIRARKKGIQNRNRSDTGNKSKNKEPRTVTSHMRSAHWHHYWIGQGRKQLIVKWIPPVFVCGNNNELPVTIHEVK